MAFGSIAGTTAVNDVRALVQAVGGNGLVTFASTTTAEATTKVVTGERPRPRTPRSRLRSRSRCRAPAEYLSSVPVRAASSRRHGVNGKRVSFRSGGVRVDARRPAPTAPARMAEPAVGCASTPFGPAGVNVRVRRRGQLSRLSGADATIAVTKAATSFVAADQTVLVGGSIVLCNAHGRGPAARRAGW